VGSSLTTSSVVRLFLDSDFYEAANLVFNFFTVKTNTIFERVLLSFFFSVWEKGTSDSEKLIAIPHFIYKFGLF
jgi:hypothetical protein